MTSVYSKIFLVAAILLFFHALYLFNVEFDKETRMHLQDESFPSGVTGFLVLAPNTETLGVLNLIFAAFCFFLALVFLRK